MDTLAATVRSDVAGRRCSKGGRNAKGGKERGRPVGGKVAAIRSAATWRACTACGRVAGGGRR